MCARNAVLLNGQLWSGPHGQAGALGRVQTVTGKSLYELVGGHALAEHRQLRLCRLERDAGGEPAEHGDCWSGARRSVERLRPELTGERAEPALRRERFEPGVWGIELDLLDAGVEADLAQVVARAPGHAEPVERPRRVAAIANQLLPPNVSYETTQIDGVDLRAKVAVLSLQQFQRGMRQAAIDTTLWARFAQPLGLAWVRDPAARTQTIAAVCAAVATAARWAALLGPERGRAVEFWQALFQRTYAAELRVERGGGRARSLIEHESERYTRLLPLAWRASSVDFRVRDGNLLEPRINPTQRQLGARAWKLRHALGKPLNLVRLAKATFTFENGADYVAWKVERHAGIQLQLSAWQRRHPLLAAPAVLWKLRRAKALR